MNVLVRAMYQKREGERGGRGGEGRGGGGGGHLSYKAAPWFMYINEPCLQHCVYLSSYVSIYLQDFVLPAGVGIPVGGVGYPTYTILELHYDNPLLTPGNPLIFGNMYVCVLHVIWTAWCCTLLGGGGGGEKGGVQPNHKVS